MATVTMQLDGRWAEFPVRTDEDPGEWAADLIDGALQRRDVTEPDAVRTLYVQTWAAMLQTLRERPQDDDAVLMTAYGLIEGPDLLPDTTLELHVAAADSGLDAFVDALVLPEDRRFGPPTVGDVTSPGGTGVRIEQLAVRGGPEDGDREQTVATSLVYVWPAPVELGAQPGTVLVLSTYFVSPIDAAQHRTAVDEFAATLDVVAS